MSSLPEERRTAIHLLRAGHSSDEVGQQLGWTDRWVRKWRKRFEEEGWPGLEDRCRAPRKHGARLPDSIRQAIVYARSELEAEAERGSALKYIGGRAVRTRLRVQEVDPLPSVATIERVLRQKELTRPYRPEPRAKIEYPHLKPDEPHQLCQVDIVPHFLTGGERVACFNAIDVVSRYPTGQAYGHRRAQDAMDFLIHVWQTIGIAHYTQVDNESCFSGGFTHQYVLGKVIRLALQVETDLVFSPVRHPESNGFVERFHQDYNWHVWQDTYLDNRDTVQRQADHFLSLYRQSQHHSALNEQAPHEVHHQATPHLLADDFILPELKLPLREGCIHFIRRVEADQTISVLNVDWPVPEAKPDTGVWATLEFRCSGVTLSVYDAAPDSSQRTCLITYPFPLSEKVYPAPRPDCAKQAGRKFVQKGVSLISATLRHTARMASKLFYGTMY